MIHLILLSGGSGTRLWPLSNSSRSKQFLKVLRDSPGNHLSRVQRVFSQIRSVDADLDVTIATCADQEFSIRSQVEGASLAYTLDAGDDAYWRLYTGPVTLDAGGTLRARAVRYGWADSADARATFTIAAR